MLDRLSRTPSDNQQVIFLTNRYEKLTKAILVSTVTLTSAATVFLDNWVIAYPILACWLTNNGLYFLFKFLTAGSVPQSIEKLTMTLYHFNSLGQVESLIRPIVAHLQPNVAEHQTDLDQ